MKGIINVGLVLVSLFAAEVNGEICENASNSSEGQKEEEINRLRLLAITGWIFFGLLSVFVVVVAVREGSIICEDIRKTKLDTEEGYRQPRIRKEQAYENLDGDQQESTVGTNYDDLQLVNENTSDQVYENAAL